MYSGMKDGALKILFISNGIFVFAGSLFGPLYAVFVQKLTDGILPISISWTVFLLSTALFMLFVSRFGDKIRKDDLLMASYVLYAIVWLSYVFISSFWQLLILQVALGLAQSLKIPSWDAIFAEHIDKNRHVEEYADWQLISNLVTAAGTMLGGIIAASFGFKYLFLAMAVFAVIAFLEVFGKSRKIGMA